MRLIRLVWNLLSMIADAWLHKPVAFRRNAFTLDAFRDWSF